MDFLVSIAPEHIKFPETTIEKEFSASIFYELSHFKDVIGCIDGTYIPISTPAHKIKSTYTNRHHQTSLTVQAICDADKRFIDVFTGTPGKIHDARVFKLSPISNTLQRICEGRFHILGDGAYEIREWLLTPYRNYETLGQLKKKYNDKFCVTRVVIENAFGMLKKRFIQLMRIDMRDVNRITKFIMSCCVLHNICVDQRDEMELDPEEETEPPEIIAEQDPNARAALLRLLGEMKRDNIANTI